MSIDLKDAYFYVPIAPYFQNCFCFTLNQLHYQFIYLPQERSSTLLRIDNMTAVLYIRKQGGTRSRSLLKEVTPIMEWAHINSLHLPAVYIPVGRIFRLTICLEQISTISGPCHCKCVGIYWLGLSFWRWTSLLLQPTLSFCGSTPESASNSDGCAEFRLGPFEQHMLG